MGGNAFNAILPSASFPRLPPPVYYTLKARLTPVLRTIFSFVETPAEAPEKQDYGDLDFTVCSPAAGISIVTSQSDGEATVSHEVLREALHAEHVIPMPGYRTSSYAVPIQRSEWSDLGFASLYDQYLEDATAEGGPRLFYQIDVHLSADEGEARRIVFFNSYGDLGMIMGLLAANNGLQFGSQGLKMPNGIWKRVLLTSDMSRAMAFMGLDKDVRERGFETKGQIFKWITNSRFFVDAPQFKLKGAGISKVKPTRSMYAEFVEWVEKITGENPEGSVEAEDIGNVIRNEFVARRRQEALVHFGLKEEYDEEMRQITLRAKVKSMFNGTVVRDWLGIHGNNNWPLVNRVMAVVRENLGGADGVARVVEAEGEQGIEREVMQAFRVVQQRTGVGPFWPGR